MFKDLSNALALISPAQSGSQADYSNVSPDQILNDPFFRRDVIENARGQGMVDFSFEEALSEWYNEQSYAELNEIGAVFGDAGYLKTEGLQGDARERMGRLTAAYQRMPNVLTTAADGGSISDQLSGADITKTLAGANLANPSNLVGGGSAKAAAYGALAVGKSTGKAAYEAGKAGAKKQFVAGAASEGAISVAGQNRDINLGNRDEFSFLEAGKDIGVGAFANYGISFLIGAALTPLAKAKLRKNKAELESRGFTQTDIDEAATRGGAAGIDELLTYESKADLEAQLALDNPVAPDVEGEIPTVPTIVTRESVDIDLEQINSTRSSVDAEIQDIDNPPTAARRKELDAEAKLLQALQDEASDVNRIYLEIDDLNARIKEGLSPEDSVKTRAKADKLMAEARSKKGDFNIRKAIYQRSGADGYIEALDNYKKAVAEAEQKAAQARAAEAEVDVPEVEQPAARVETKAAAPQVQPEQPTQKTPIQQEAVDAETQAELDEAEDFDQLLADDAPEATVPEAPVQAAQPAQPAPVQVIQPEAAPVDPIEAAIAQSIKEDGPFPVEAKPDVVKADGTTKPAPKPKPVFSPRAKKFAQIALGVDENLDLEKISKGERNRISREILTAIDGDNISDWKDLNLAGKIARIDEIMEVNAQKAIPEVAATPAPVIVVPTEAATPAPVKAVEPEVAEPKASGDPEAIEFKKAFDLESTKPFDLPENLATFASEQADPEASIRLATLFSSIVETGSEVVLGDKKLMKSVMQGIFGLKDGKAIYREYLKVHQEAYRDLDGFTPIVSKMSKADSNFERKFINDYISARKARVTSEVKSKFTGYWDNKSNHYVISDLTEKHTKAWRADAQEILRSQYNLRGASLAHWEMFSDIKPSKKASEAYIKSALRGELPESKRQQLTEGVVLSQDMAVSHANKTQRPVAFLTTRSIGAKYALTEGYPVGSYKNGRHYIPAGQIVFYSPYDNKFYQSTRELLQANNRISPEQRDTFDVAEYVDINDFRDRDKILGTGFQALLARYKTIHTEKNIKDPVTGEKVKTKVAGYQRIGEMQEFIVSRFLLQQEIQNQSTDTFFSLAQKKTEQVDAPATPAKKTTPRKKSEGTVEEPIIPPRQRLALLSKDGESIRVITDAQLERGDGINVLLGKADISDFEVGFVPMDSPKSSDLTFGLLVDLYQKNTDQPVRKMFTDHAPNIKDLANFKAKDFLSDEEFEFIYDGYKKWLEPDITRADRTMDEIVFMIQGIDSKTRIKDGEFDSAFDGITKLLEIQKKYFPQGVGRTTEKRGNSIAHARRVLAGYEPDEKVNAGTLLKELGKGNYDAVSKLMLAIRGAVDVVNPRMGAPVVGKNQNSDISGSLIAYPDGKNEIKVNSKENVYPKFAVLIHEVAHWSYQNAMTPEMRLEFWNSIKEAVYTDGKVDPEKLANTTGHIADSSDDYIERLGLDGSSFSAQEYFANAFTKWAMRERHADMANTSYWQKVSSFVFSLMEKLQGKESGDPKLDAIFAQLYPENTAANRQAKKYVKIYSTSNPPKHVIEAESTAQFVMRQRLDELKGVWDTFSYNLTSNGLPAGEFSGTIVNNARKLSRTLNSLSMTRGESRRLSSQGLDNDPILGPSGTNTTKGGALGPLADKGYAKKMRVLAKEINTIVTQNLSGDAGQTVLPKERFDYDKFNELYDDFSETNILTDEADEFFSMAAEIAEVKDGDINGIFQFIDQNQVSEVDFDSGLTLQMYDADPMGHKEAAEKLTELINSNKDLIDGAAQVLADNYYQYSREGYALAVPSDNILKLYSITGNKKDLPLDKKAAQVRNSYKNAAKKAARLNSATNSLPKAGYRSLEGLSGQEFAAKHQEALDSGDKDAINNVYFEAYRRGTADSIHHLSGDAAIKSGQVQSAIDMENVTKIDSDGVWADAPLTIRDSTKMMTHRDPEVQANMRLMFQRMYGLINASTRSIVDDVPLMDTYTLGKISGENLSDSYGAVRDFSTAKFGSLRSDLRRIAIGLDRETSDPKALMHEIGHVLKRALPHEDLLVIQDAYKMAIKAKDPVATEFASQYKTSTNSDQAEEWFVESWANYLANRVSKEEIITDYSGDGLMSNDLLVVKGKLGQYLDMMSEYAMYGLNGLIGRNDVKQMFRRLTFSGNLVQRQTILGNMSNHYIPSSYLKDSAQQAIKDMPTDGQRNLRNFVQGSITGIGGRIAPLYYATTGRILDKVVPDNFMGKNRLSGAIYVATTPETAAKVFTDPKSKARPYNRKEVVDAVTRLSELNGEDANEMTQFVLDEIYLLENLVDKRHRMINDSVMAKSAMEDPSMSDRKVKNTIAYKELTEEIESLNDNITEIVEYFEVKVGISPIEHNAVVVSSIKPNEVLSFSAETPINDKNTGVYKDLLAIMTPTMKEADYRLLSGKLDSAITAAHAFDVLSSVSGSSTSLPRALKELNFKAAKVTTDDGDDVIALMVPQQVKKLNETEFTNPEVIPVINETATLSTVTGEMMLHVDSLEKKVDVNPSAVAQAIASMVERNGSNSAAADTISQMTRGYVGQGETAKKFLGGVKNTFSTLLSENSVQIREGGMGWLGNLIKPENGVGHYEKHGSRVGKKVMPIIKLIQDINGPEKGTGRRYMDRVNQWGYKPSQGEARVLKAMRRPVGNDFEKRLKGDERRLYDMLRAQFKGELEEMRGLGVLIGNIKNYIPQVWDVNMINKSKETQLQFKTSLSSYFVSEARNRGDVLPLGEAEKRAGKMLARLTDDDGVYIPSRHVNQTGSKTDHLDFSRVVRLDEFPEHLDDLEGFLVNDLGGITTKYFNESSRRILLTKDFGLESHGFYDYMQTHENGLKGAAQLLSSGKVQRRSIESRDGEDVTVLEHQLFMPIARNEAHGMEIMKVAMDILETQGMPAAKEHLMSLALKRQPALERRVDSILTALSETGGATSSTVTDYKHAFGMFDTLRGRSASRGGTYDEGARRFSKNARMFNSVSLLSYTVVTSMTDLVLPIIRTGSISSAMKGLAKVNADPDYREAIRNVGTGMASIAHNKLVHMSGSEGDKLSNAFFSGIGLNQWTEYMRDYAASTAYEAIKAEQRIAIRSMRGDGTDMSKQGADFRRAKRFLARVGLGNFAERGAQSLDSVKLLENDQVREAIHRMTNEAVFAPNGNDIPLIWQSPLGSMLFQFKSFPLMMGRLARMALWDNVGKPMLTKGEPVSIAPAAMLLTLAPLFGEQVLSLRDTITAKGGEEGGEYKRRERSANKFLETFGMDEDDPVFESEQMDALAGRYVEGFMYAGGFGLLADLFHQSAEQVDNGAYGQNRIMSTFLGPTAGAIFGTGVNVVAGAVDGNDDSNSKERQAWREVIGRIPLVGQNRQIKEDAVDYLGGAATR